MQGNDCLWMPGTDHAGIATQAVVERRLLEEEKKTRHDIGRDELVRRIWEWKDEYEARILAQLRQMGCSCDWTRTRFTLDLGCTRAVRHTFFRLFQAGKIFRGKRLVNWDTQLRTAVADDEITYEEIQGNLWTIKYPVTASPSGEFVLVSTTRPETMLGDTAVAVHPDDGRYRHLVGKSVTLPLLGREIPVLADATLVDPTFGTGCVKVTPAHDPNDYATGLRHSLPQINLLNPDGTYNENAGPYAGLDRLVVRKRVIADLEAQGLLARVEPYVNRIGHSDRSKSPIEPFLSDQWFVRMGDDADGTPGFAQMAIDSVTSGRVRIHPERYAKSYVDWLAEKRDWCISRQLWWGHRIPIWYCDSCEETDLTRAFGDRDDVCWTRAESRGWLICSETDLESDELGPQHFLIQDPDVLDTWFSSALWPHSTMGWPELTPELVRYYPTSVLSTARDIITLWVARMVIFGLFNMNDVPFRDVFIHPVIQDGHGRRMSKSAGNGVDPADIIELHGADALRFTLAAGATETQDLRMPVETVSLEDGRKINSSERFEQGRNFANKFWNAARFALLNLEDFEGSASAPTLSGLSIPDMWILSELDRTTAEVTAALESYQFAEAARLLRDFTWNDFCDWYLELAKATLRGGDTESRWMTQRTVASVLDRLCRLLHPIMPFVTEEVWQSLNRVAPRRCDLLTGELHTAAESVCIAPWPNPGEESVQAADARRAVVHWQEKITALRNLRAERGVPPSAKIQPILVATGAVASALEQGIPHICSLAGAQDVRIVPAAERPSHSAVAVLVDCEIILPMGGLIDPKAERARHEKARGEIEKQLASIRAKLANEAFLSRAPAELVEKQRSKEVELLAQREAVDTWLEALSSKS
jgi:valyl-tRNA synthetase